MFSKPCPPPVRLAHVSLLEILSDILPRPARIFCPPWYASITPFPDCAPLWKPDTAPPCSWSVTDVLLIPRGTGLPGPR